MVEGKDITLGYLECPQLANLDPEPRGIPVPNILNPASIVRVYNEVVSDLTPGLNHLLSRRELLSSMSWKEKLLLVPQVVLRAACYGGLLVLVPVGIVSGNIPSNEAQKISISEAGILSQIALSAAILATASSQRRFD